MNSVEQFPDVHTLIRYTAIFIGCYTLGYMTSALVHRRIHWSLIGVMLLVIGILIVLGYLDQSVG